MKIILSVSNLLDTIIKKIISVLLMIMTVVLFSQVIARHVMGTGLSWSEELVRYMCVWIIFLGATCAAKDGSQVSVTALDEILNGLPKKLLGIIQSILASTYCVLLSWIGFGALEFAKLQKSPNMMIPMNIVYSVIPIAMIIMLIHLVTIFLQNYIIAKEVHE
ncbi:TRAP transporter small permease [Sedimentibacter sp.]|uniref:TRAP transporter small permease n=1 Tax=Sedimentibacter sp. TaxID=1960295 RepID=UPI0028AFD1AB|nr:TRAP transporter small permease [Sedimentibacter sp.]